VTKKQGKASLKLVEAQKKTLENKETLEQALRDGKF
jgi:hypothetical protein